MFASTTQEVRLSKKIQSYRVAPNTVSENVCLEKNQATARNILDLANRFEGDDNQTPLKRLELKTVSFSTESTRALVDLVTRPYCSIEEIQIINCRAHSDKLNSICQGLLQSLDLRSFELVNTNISASSHASFQELLEKSTNMQHYSLRGCALSDIGMKKIAEGIQACSTLVSLDFRHNNFENEGLFALLKAIKSKKSLKTLRIDNLDLDSQELALLEEVFSSPNCSIRNLEISEFQVKESCKGDLMKAILQLQRIDNLNMALYHGGYTLAQGQVELISKFNHLQSLGFYACKLNDEAVSNLVKGLRGSQLTCFNVAKNFLTSACLPEISVLLKNNLKLDKLLLEHNNFGGSNDTDFTHFAQVLSIHTGLKYLDLSSNSITNTQFVQIFAPIRTGESQLKQLHMKANKIGGDDLQDIFLSQSKSLNVLSLEDNQLSEYNAQALVEFSRKNMMIMHIGIKGNQDVTSELIFTLNDECRMNICINQFILPQLGKSSIAVDDIEKNFLATRNVLVEYDIHTLHLQNQAYFRLNFIRKFIMEAKEHLQHLSLVKIFTHTKIDSSLNTIFGSKVTAQLTSIHLEETNLSLRHFQTIVAECAKMSTLTSVKFIKMAGVADSMKQICKAFAKHKHIRELSLNNCQIKNYQDLPSLLKKNTSITRLDIDRNPISSKAMVIIWMGLHMNISIVDLVYSASRSFFDLKTIQAMQIEITKNKNIKEELLTQYDRIHRKDLSLSLGGFTLKNFESVVKYILRHDKVKNLDLQNTNIQIDQLNRLIIEMGNRHLNIQTLNLSRNSSCGDQMCRNIALLFEGNSPLEKLILDETSVKINGLIILIKAARQNLKVRTIQARDCGLVFNKETSKDFLLAIQDNISLTNVDLHGNEIDHEFMGDLQKELDINKVIVERIFPKLINQELEARENVKTLKMQKKASKKRGNASNMVVSRDGPEESQQESDNSALDDSAVEIDEKQMQLNKLSNLMNQQKTFQLCLDDMKIDDMSFVTKFLKVFPKINQIDFGTNELNKKDKQQFGEVLKWNKYLQEVKSDNVNDKQYRNILNEELEKNKKIQDMQEILANQTENSQLVLKDQGFTDLSFLPKIVKDFSNLQLLDLSNNDFREPSSLDQLEIMIHETKTVQHLVLSNCKISAKGLNNICSFLSIEDAYHIRSIDIQNNPIPDPQLKILFSLLQRNKQILDVKFTLTEHENIQHWSRYMSKKEAMGQIKLGQSMQIMKSYQGEIEHEAHEHHEIKLWEKIVFPIWIFKVLIHDKHEAFRFKYNTEKINNLEQKLMPGILKSLYFSSIVYYIIVFILPNFFTKNECGKAFKVELFYIYGIYTVVSMIWEIVTVIRIQKALDDKSLLKFNKWHTVELFMGTIARLDTFLDVLFVILIGHCYTEFIPYFVPSLFFAIINFIFPTYLLLRLCSTKFTRAQTQPYLENCCFVSFIRENMLLATVLDSFCIDNSVSFRGKPIVFGKLMGFFSFSTQDLPQFIIHVIFKFVIVSKAQKKLKTEKLLIVSLVVSFLALCISIFNMIMCDQNEFDPIVLQCELDARAEIERKESVNQKRNTIRGMGLFGGELGNELKEIIKAQKQKKLEEQNKREDEGIMGKMLKAGRIQTQESKNTQILAANRHFLAEQGNKNKPIRQDIPNPAKLVGEVELMGKNQLNKEAAYQDKTIEVENVENKISSTRQIDVPTKDAPLMAGLNSEDNLTANSPLNSVDYDENKSGINPTFAPIQPMVLLGNQEGKTPGKKFSQRPKMPAHDDSV